MDKSETKILFYNSQILFEDLNNHILFRTEYSIDDTINKLNENKNILIPERDEIENFYSIFTNNINNNSILKKLFIGENYKSKIFDLYDST